MDEIITPEIIVKKFANRLKNNIEELEYLVYMDKKFEKWLQYELVLAMSDVFRPVVYDEKFNELKDDETGEKIFDIATEYTIDGNKGNLRSDVLIAEKPFIFKYADKTNWQITSKSSAQKCKDLFSSVKFHYIELKYQDWIDIHSPNSMEIDIMTDLNKYLMQDWRSFKPTYNPSSAISLSCVSFMDSKEKFRNIPQSEIKEAFEAVCRKMLKEIKKNYQIDGFFLWEKVAEDIYLISVFYNI